MKLARIFSLLWNLLLVYIAYTVCRITFLIVNAKLYSGMELSHVMDLLTAGLVFDSSAICYTNSPIILLFLFPLHFKEREGYYKVARWVYVVLNSICVIANLCDVVYFPFTGKRTTVSVLQEFSNEGTAQMANIFYEHTLSNWYLLLIGLALMIMFYFGFKSGATKKEKLVPYYATQIVSLCALGYLCFGLMRGGFGTSTRPITISNANQYVDSPAEAGAVLNTPFSIIRTIGKKPFIVPEYMTIAEAESLYSPVHKLQPDSLLPLANRNVVVIIMESFSKQHIGFYNITHNENGPKGDKITFTPYLDQFIADSCLTFRYSYANGRKSIEGMPSVLSSIPNFVEPFFLTPAAMNNISGLARELSENCGYTSAFFHGAPNGSMGFEAFARSSGFQKYYGLNEYCKDKKYHGMDDFDGTWAIWDEEFLQFYCDRMNEMKQPFITSVFTATSHSPYDLPERYVGKYRKGKDPSQELVMYSDNALHQFFESAKKQPWFKNTIFVITADHTSANVDPYYVSTTGCYCVPIVFYAPGSNILRGYDEETIVEQIDIMPTLFGMLGYKKAYIGFGQDIFHTKKEDKFAIHWLPESNMYEFVKGDYSMRFDGQKLQAVYQYKTDLLQEDNLLNKIPKDSIDKSEKIMKSLIQQYMTRMNSNKLVIKQ